METAEIQAEHTGALDTTQPLQLIEKAVMGGVDLETLEKLMELQKRFEEREAEKRFKRDYNKWQANKPILIKDSKATMKFKDGGQSEYDFMSLAGIQKAVDPILGEYGFSYDWSQSNENGKIRIFFNLSHIDGHVKVNWLEADADTSGYKNSIQAMASTVSYLKRYTLENGLGLTSHKDDDANKLTMTEAEKQDMFLEQIISIYAEVEPKIPQQYKKGIDDIIKYKKVSEYVKTKKYLLSLK